MKKNYDRNSKLRSYSAMAGSLLAIANGADAQIKYTNLNPDSVLNLGQTMVLDIDTNGTTDFSLTIYSSSGAMVAEANVLNNPNNAITGSLYSGAYPLPYAKQTGDTIKANLPWNNLAVNNGLQYLGLVYGSYTFGNFVNTTDKFIGIRFNNSTTTMYGWIRISINASCNQLTVNDYAFQSNGNPIICGMTTDVGIKESLSPFVHIHSFEKTVYVNVDKGLPLNGEIQITNLLGETIQTCKLQESAQKIDLSAVSTGVYFVTLHHEKGDLVKKIYIN